MNNNFNYSISVACNKLGIEPWMVKQSKTIHGMDVNYIDELILSARLGGRVLGILINASFRTDNPLTNILEDSLEKIDMAKIFSTVGRVLTDEEKKVINTLREEADLMYQITGAAYCNITTPPQSLDVEFLKGCYNDVLRLFDGSMNVSGLLTFTNRTFLIKELIRLESATNKNDYRDNKKENKKEQIPSNYSGAIEETDNSKFIIYKEHGLYGLKRRSGSIVLKPEYDDIYDCNEFGWEIKKGNKYGRINNYGVVFLPVEFEDIMDDFLDNGYGGYVVEKNGKYGYFDNYGHKIVDIIYDDLDEYQASNSKYISSAFIAKLDDKYGLINHDGRIIVPVEYDYLKPNERDSIIEVRKDGKTGYMDMKGKVIFPFDDAITKKAKSISD